MGWYEKAGRHRPGHCDESQSTCFVMSPIGLDPKLLY